VRDIITAGSGANIFKPATRSYGLDQLVPGARNFIRRTTEGCDLDQPDPSSSSFLNQRGTAIIER
jgi:hypothetical protein